MYEILESPVAELVVTPNIDGFWPIDRWLDRLRSDGVFAAGRSGFPSGPLGSRFRTDIVERDDAFEILADVPGIPKEQIEVRVRGTQLSIHAGATSEPEPPGASYVLRERRGSTFERTFELPEPVPASSIQAKIENGVLTVRIPKAKPVAEETVPVA